MSALEKQPFSDMFGDEWAGPALLELWACGPLDCTSIILSDLRKTDPARLLSVANEDKSAYKLDNNNNIVTKKRETIFLQRNHVIHIYAFTIHTSF